MLIVPFGVYFTNKIFKIEFVPQFNQYLSKEIIDKQPENHFFMFYFFALLFALTVTLIYFSKLDIIPLNFIIEHLLDEVNYTDLAKLRESATTTFTLGKLHRYRFFMAQVIPFLLIVAFSYYLQ